MPVVPPAHLEQIRASVREEWRAAIDQRDAAGRPGGRVAAGWAAAAVVLAALGFGWWWLSGGPVEVQLATLEVVNLATVERQEDPEAVAGAALYAGDELVVAEGGSAAFRLAAGESVRLRSGSRMRLLGAGQVELLAGATYVDSDRTQDHTPMEVHTPFGVVRDIGTQFEVALADPAATGSVMSVKVREGIVVLAPQDGSPPQRAEAGHQVVLAAGGAATVRPLEDDPAQWTWAIDAAPPLELEGRSVAQVLEAAAREFGYQVVYFDAAAQERSRQELSGQPLATRDALQVALQAAELTATRMEGRLEVRQQD
jgi:hypothetical protein